MTIKEIVYDELTKNGRDPEEEAALFRRILNRVMPQAQFRSEIERTTDISEINLIRRLVKVELAKVR